MSDFSVHGQPDFAPVYDEDDLVTIRRGDLRALLDLATGSLDFGSGFWDNEQTEAARKCAVVCGLDPIKVTPRNFLTTYEPDRVAVITHATYSKLWEKVRAAGVEGGGAIQAAVVALLQEDNPNIAEYIIGRQS